jgi:RNA polymerase sigma-70 factor (ECF subfamily)
MDSEEAARLLELALAGERDALARLVSVLTPVIQARTARTLLTRRLASGERRSIRSEVEDLCQEVLLGLFAQETRVLRSWQAERGLSLENFVGMVAERHVVSFLRSGRRNPWRETPGGEEDLEVAAAEVDPEVATASREELRLVLGRLRAAVSPLGWRLFELLFIQELALPEVMAATGQSADAVYAWRSRLRKQAQLLLAEVSGNRPSRRTSVGGGRS